MKIEVLVEFRFLKYSRLQEICARCCVTSGSDSLSADKHWDKKTRQKGANLPHPTKTYQQAFEKIKTHLCYSSKPTHLNPNAALSFSLYLTEPHTHTYTHQAKEMEQRAEFVLQICSMQMSPSQYLWKHCRMVGWLHLPKAPMTNSWKTEWEIPKKGHYH